MPTLARWYIKAALVYFVLALLAGVIVQARTVIDLPSRLAALRPVYIHLLTVGWITQLIIGVGYWMFPKFSRENPRGSERLAWATFVLLNVGLALRVISEPQVSIRAAGPFVDAGALRRVAVGRGLAVRDQYLGADQGALTCRRSASGWCAPRCCTWEWASPSAR